MTRRDRTNDMHHVYRCYDNTGRLIYVGATANLWGRLDGHRKSTWWAHQVARVTAKVYPNGMVARIAERQAIHTENPRWNVQSRWSAVQHRPLADLLDYRQAFIAQGNANTCGGRAHAERIDRAIKLAEIREQVAA